jgi:hypothetical protein
MLPPVHLEPPSRRTAILARASEHDEYHEARQPGVEEQVADREHVAEWRWCRDHVGERSDHVLVGHQVVLLRPPDRDLVRGAARDPHGLGAHRHPAVRDDDHQVEREAEEHQWSTGEPAIDPHTSDQQGVRGGEKAPHREAIGILGQRYDLEAEPHERGPPPVDAEMLERTQAPVRGESGDDGQGENDEDEQQCGLRCPVGIGFSRPGHRKSSA